MSIECLVMNYFYLVVLVFIRMFLLVLRVDVMFECENIIILEI